MRSRQPTWVKWGRAGCHAASWWHRVTARTRWMAGGGIVLGAGNLTGTNPLFVNAPVDYHLRADSPLRRQGDSSFNPGVDFEGDPRFNPPDIGADEVVMRALLPLIVR